MGLFDGYVDPDQFRDSGGLLGRLLSLRPDLAQDQVGVDQPALAPQTPTLSSSVLPTSSASPTGAGIVHPVQYAQAPHGILSIDPLRAGPINPPVIGGGALFGLGLGALILNNAKNAKPPGDEEETVGAAASRPPTGSVPINQTPWSGDHTEIKEAIGSENDDHVSISLKGHVWAQNPDGSWTNHGPASSFTGSGRPSGQREKDRDQWN